MPIHTFINSSGDIFYLVVVLLYVTIFVTNRWQLSYELDYIEPFTFIYFFFLDLAVGSSGGWSMQGGI